MYDNKPDVVAGNEDCGQMSVWFVIGSLGPYAVDPVSARYDIGTPLSDRVEIKVSENSKPTIEANRQSVKGLTVEHAQLVKGGTLVLYLADEPTSVS